MIRWRRSSVSGYHPGPLCLSTPFAVDPPRSGSGPTTEVQARLDVSLRLCPFHDAWMPTVTAGLAAEEAVCGACLGRGGRDDQALTSAAYGLGSCLGDLSGAEAPSEHGSGLLGIMQG
jgi:hypothetical protein